MGGEKRMFNLFNREQNQKRTIQQLVLADMALLPKKKISNLVLTDNSYLKKSPGRKVSFYCRASKKAGSTKKVFWLN